MTSFLEMRCDLKVARLNDNNSSNKDSIFLFSLSYGKQRTNSSILSRRIYVFLSNCFNKIQYYFLMHDFFSDIWPWTQKISGNQLSKRMSWYSRRQFCCYFFDCNKQRNTLNRNHTIQKNNSMAYSLFLKSRTIRKQKALITMSSILIVFVKHVYSFFVYYYCKLY